MVLFRGTKLTDPLLIIEGLFAIFIIQIFMSGMYLLVGVAILYLLYTNNVLIGRRLR